ncbi:MAG: response regulator transcription factor [Bacteroidia bacterium]|nr:response regulator transcription factor [Bacteroidia bacterium]
MLLKILLAEDEENIASTIVLNLELEGYMVSHASKGKQALELATKKHYDLIILDVMLPEMDGFTICEGIRKAGITTPILFLTAKGTSTDRVLGLKLGADDYLTKPFDLEEFLLRIKNLLKRNPAVNDTSNIYSFNNNTINYISYEITNSKGEVSTVSKREMELLKLLIQRANQVISREEILERLWNDESLPTPRTIDNFILSYRKLFEQNSKEPQHFHSIRGVGYKFTP